VVCYFAVKIMHLYRTSEGPVVHFEGNAFSVDCSWTELFQTDDLFAKLKSVVESGSPNESAAGSELLPMTDQEVWAAGVTYFRSKTARMDESKDAGGGDGERSLATPLATI